MPSKSKKQARFMAAAAHNPKFAKKAGIKRSVAKEFNKADAGTGILKKGIGGAIKQVMSRVGQGRSGPIGRAVKGALSQIKRPPPPKGPPPSIAKGQAFRGRNAGPIKANPVTEADNTLSETGEGLRRVIGRVGSGPKLRYKEGGKVGPAMTALQKLAQEYKAALDMDDTEKAGRIKRQMERLKRGSTKEADVEDAKVGEEKAATFSKGGKVGKAQILWKTTRNDGIPSYLDAVDTHLKRDPTDDEVKTISNHFKKTPDEVRASLARRRQFTESQHKKRYARYAQMLESGKLTQSEYDALTTKD